MYMVSIPLLLERGKCFSAILQKLGGGRGGLRNFLRKWWSIFGGGGVVRDLRDSN